MKVLQVTPVLQHGGAEHVATYLAHHFGNLDQASIVSILSGGYSKYLQQRKVPYKVLAPWWRKSLQRFISAKLIQKTCFFLSGGGGGELQVDTRLPPQWDFLLKTCPDYVKRFSSFISQTPYDIVHIHSLTCASLFRNAKENGFSVVYGHHNILSNRHGKEDVDFLKEQLFWVDAVVCVSEASREDFIQTTGFPVSRVSVIPNPSFLASGIKQEVRKIYRVGTVSNLQAAKGIDVLLDGWAKVTALGIDVELVIAGGSPGIVSFWQRRAVDLGIQGSVTFLGEITEQSEMCCFYNQLDLMLVPSRTEAFPLQIVEGMSRGIPIVASDIPALREVVSESGLLFPVGDSDRLAECIGMLCNSLELAAGLGELGFVRWQTYFSSEKVLAKYSQLYERLLLLQSGAA